MKKPFWSFPKNFRVPDSVLRPSRIACGPNRGARILDGGEIGPETPRLGAQSSPLGPTGADPKVLAAVIRGEVADTLPAQVLRRVSIPVLMLNGKAHVANQKMAGLLQQIPNAGHAVWEGDHRLARQRFSTRSCTFSRNAGDSTALDRRREAKAAHKT
jgi:hypothetical protein